MTDPKKIIVFGGATLESAEDGSWNTKAPIKEYLYGLKEFYDEVNFATLINTRPADYIGKLETDIVNVISIPSKVKLLSAYFTLLQKSKGADVLLYFPLSILLFPIIPLLKLRCKTLGCYLACDYSAYDQKSIKGKLFVFIHEQMIRWCNVVIARGKYLAGKAQKLNNCVTETVPIGNIDLSLIDKPFRERGADYLFIGKLERGKGVLVLLKAFHKFTLEIDSTAKLHIVGSGLNKNEFVSYVQENNLSDSVIFHGYVEDKEELEKLFTQAKILIMPSIHPEGVPRVIDEAIIRRVPVIATKVGGVPDEFPNGEVLLIEPDNSEDLFRAVKLLNENTNLITEQLEIAEKRLDMWKKFESAAHQHSTLIVGKFSQL